MGMQKRLRAAQRNIYCLVNGERPFSSTPLGAGQVRARERLLKHRAEQQARMNPPPVVEEAVEEVKPKKRAPRKKKTETLDT